MMNRDWQGLKPLIVKLGGFPDQMDKLEQFLKIVNDNKAGVSFRSVAKLAEANNKPSLTAFLSPKSLVAILKSRN